MIGCTAETYDRRRSSDSMQEEYFDPVLWFCNKYFTNKAGRTLEGALSAQTTITEGDLSGSAGVAWVTDSPRLGFTEIMVSLATVGEPAQVVLYTIILVRHYAPWRY